MRRACGSTVRSPSPTLSLLTRGWAGGAQHRQPVARRPCPHERSKTWARTRPKNSSVKYLNNPHLYIPYLLKPNNA
ncbi:MAG: hypothetical protein NZ455_08970 [Bacteroidia bacterium]|nr:hypothetical protein [Bacteroidia bacterium]MDW8346296.1 hypothetical protein [Bacteroidia bacterium]